MNPITAFLYAFTDGKLPPIPTHFALIGVIAVAEISLAFGIWLESPKNKALREWTGLGLVFGGCTISALFTVFLLIFDEGISRGQQSKIIALEERLAPRSLSAKAVGRITAKIKNFAGQEFNGMIASDVSDAWDLWRAIGLALIEAKWKWVYCVGKPTDRLGVPSCVAVSPLDGVMIYFSPLDRSGVAAKANALAKALRDEGIRAAAAYGAVGLTNPNDPSAGVEYNAYGPANAITIVIGPKPQK